MLTPGIRIQPQIPFLIQRIVLLAEEKRQIGLDATLTRKSYQIRVSATVTDRGRIGHIVRFGPPVVQILQDQAAGVVGVMTRVSSQDQS